MIHPQELYADYVAGTASASDRATVQDHLAVCERCADEVARATTARDTLRRLPPAGVPEGFADRVMEQAAAPAGRGGPPAWYRWGGIAAAAAVFALLLTLVLPRLGGGGGSPASNEKAGAAIAPTMGGAVPLEISGQDLGSNGSLTQLAQGYARKGSVTAPESTGAATGAPTDAAAAQACIQRAFRTVDGTLVRLVRARFRGTPAYLGFYEVGPGAGQPPNALTVRVASVLGCRPLSIAQAPLS